MIFQCYLSLYFKGLNGSQMMHKAQAGLGCKGTIHPKKKSPRPSLKTAAIFIAGRHPAGLIQATTDRQLEFFQFLMITEYPGVTWTTSTESETLCI